jgi:glycosyltransferase involved in cell wall biosynthesis
MAEKRRVVVVCDWFAPAFRAGGPVQSLVNAVEQLHPYFDFHIITSNVDYGNLSLDVKPNEWISWKGQAQVYYCTKEQLSRRSLFSLLDQTVQEDDVLYVQGIFSLYFSIYPLLWWQRSKRKKIVVAPRGMLHESARKVKPFKKAIYLTLTKAMGWFNNVNWHSTNAEETLEVKKVMGFDIHLIEAANFPKPIPVYLPGKLSEKPLKIISVGRISEEKNPLMLLEMISALDKEVELTMVGGYVDESYYKQFQRALKALPAYVHVTYKQSVLPEDMQALYRNHHLFVSASKGENFGHAIAEALSYGLPCFIGLNTPWSGLESAGAGKQLPLESNTFVSAILEYLAKSTEEKEKMSLAAHKFAVEQYKTEILLEQYQKLFNINAI